MPEALEEPAARRPGDLTPGTELELHRAVSAATACLIVTLDRRGRIVSFNPACERLTGYAADEVVGEHVWDRLLGADEVEPVKRVFEDLAGGTRASEAENCWIAKDGAERRIRWSNTIVTDAGGEVEYVVGTGIDVTEEHRALFALAEREARLSTIVNTAVEGIISIDAEGTVESINPAALRIFGYRSEEVLGRNISMLMPEPYRGNHDRYIQDYLRTGEAKIIGVGREVEGLRSDGTRFPADIAVSAVELPGRHLFTGIVRDISDRRRAEEEARLRLNDIAHAARLLELGEMTTGIAHEVNQPLAAIASYAHACLRMLKSGMDSQDLFHDALEQIAAQSHRAGEIIQRLRGMARKGENLRESVDVNALVLNVIKLLDRELQRNGVHVNLDLESGLAPVLADRIQVEQVVVILMRNAVDAMANCGRERRRLAIRTETGPDGDGVRVSVADEGVGLSDGESEKVFDTFYTTKPHGIGVGLSISRSIMEAHGGRLWAVPAPEHGAIFSFDLPSRDPVYDRA